MDYMIVEATNIQDLVNSVAKYLQDSCVLVGGMVVHRDTSDGVTTYYQTMVRYTQPTEPETTDNNVEVKD